MVDGPLRSVIRQLRRIVVAQGGARAMSDAQLVEAFLYHRDETAVEMLVWRHGTMVLNLCRRILQDQHHAEDAFQATFLIFIRKVDSIDKSQSIGSWLYKTASRVAYRLRAKLAKLPQQSEQVDQLRADEPADDLIWRDLRWVLDEEIDRLPEKYRAPIVLCYLQGHTNEEAAEILHCPKGTVVSRLARGRDRLKGRLTRRGLAMSAGWLAMQLGVNASSAAVPTTLVDTTVRAAIAFADGQAANGIMSSSVAALTQGVLRTMFITKLTKAAAIVFAVAALCLGAGSVAQWALAGSGSGSGVSHESYDAQDKIQPKKGEEFLATIKKVEGNKVTLNRSTKDKKADDVTLTAVDKVKVFEKKFKQMITIMDLNDLNDPDILFEDAPVDDGLKSKLFAKEVRARITTDAKNNIIEIRLQRQGGAAIKKIDNRVLAVAIGEKVQQQAADFFATIKKVAGNKVTINRSTKDNKVDDVTLTAVDKIKVFEKKLKDGIAIAVNGNNNGPEALDGLFNLDVFEDFPVEDGLKNKLFAKEVRARITTDAKNNITEVHVLQLNNIRRAIIKPDID